MLGRLIIPRRRFLSGAAATLAAPALILPKLVLAQGGMGPGPGMAHSTGGGSLGLQANLGSFFSLDNTLSDATGAVTNLTNNNTVTFVSSSPAPIAAVSNSAKFVSASSQFLSHADATGLNVAGINFSLQVWFNTTTNSKCLVSKSSGAFGSREYEMLQVFSSPFTLQSTVNDGTVVTTGNITQSAWHHYVFTWNNATKAQIIYIDGSSAGSGTGNQNPAGTSQFNIGADGGGANFFGGNICLVGVWRNRILSAGDVTLLYNSGTGLSYAAMA